MSITLDPFAFQPHLASRFIGLGGAEASDDLAYVFHSAYVSLEPGRYQAMLAFATLIADAGTLVVRVNALPDGPAARATVVATDSLRMREVVETDGRAFVGFDVVAGCRYAILGHNYDDETASAAGLTITLETVTQVATVALEGFDDIAPSTARYERQDDVGLLVDAARPSLRAPRSQHATVAQLAEAQSTWSDPREAADKWLVAYIDRLRAVYGVDGESFVTAICGDAPAALAHLGGSAGAVASPSDMLLIAIDPATRAMTSAVRAAMVALRPGGIAVILVPLAMPHAIVPPEEAFDVARVQRLAIELLSWNFDVTQLAYDWTDAVPIEPGGDTTWFALIARRPLQAGAAT
jgi:hypothetical protein